MSPDANSRSAVSSVILASSSKRASVRCCRSPPAIRKQFEEPRARRWANPALGDQRRDEPCRRHVEGVVGGGAVSRGQANGDALSLLRPAFDMGDLAIV